MNQVVFTCRWYILDKIRILADDRFYSRPRLDERELVIRFHFSCFCCYPHSFLAEKAFLFVLCLFYRRDLWNSIVVGDLCLHRRSTSFNSFCRLDWLRHYMPGAGMHSARKPCTTLFIGHPLASAREMAWAARAIFGWDEGKVLVTFYLPMLDNSVRLRQGGAETACCCCGHRCRAPPFCIRLFRTSFSFCGVLFLVFQYIFVQMVE